MNADLSYLLEVLIGIILTAVAYMAVPFSYMMFNLWKTGERFEKSAAKRISLINSIIIAAFFLVVTSLSGGEWRLLPAIVYYYINCLVLTG